MHNLITLSILQIEYIVYQCQSQCQPNVLLQNYINASMSNEQGDRTASLHLCSLQVVLTTTIKPLCTQAVVMMMITTMRTAKLCSLSWIGNLLNIANQPCAHFTANCLDAVARVFVVIIHYGKLDLTFYKRKRASYTQEQAGLKVEMLLTVLLFILLALQTSFSHEMRILLNCNFRFWIKFRVFFNCNRK